MELFSNFLPLPPESVRSGGRTLTSQPKFLGGIDNQMFLVMGIRYNYSSYLVVYLSLYNGVNVTRAVIGRCPGTIKVQIHG